MATDPLTTLRDDLAVPEEALAVLGGLPADDQARFAQTVEAAVTAEIRRVDHALEATLKLVPAPLRARARGLLFPGDAS